MEGWDLDKVRELKAQYEAAGVTTTSSYNFLSSIVQAGSPPRGRGITWLQQLLEQGPPSDISKVLTRVERLIKEVPTCDMERFPQMIRSSGRVEKWQHEKIDAAEAALEKGWRDLAPSELAVMQSLIAIADARRYWWINRASQHRRYLLIKDILLKSGRIMQADFEFVTGLFGPAYRELTKPSFAEGDLVKVKGSPRSGGSQLGVITSAPKVKGDDVAYDVLIGEAGIVTVERDLLLKRLK